MESVCFADDASRRLRELESLCSTPPITPFISTLASRTWQYLAFMRGQSRPHLDYFGQMNMTSSQHHLETIDELSKNTSILHLQKKRYCASMWILQRVEAGRHGRIRLVWRQKSQDQSHYISSHRSFRKTGQVLTQVGPPACACLYSPQRAL